jgi:outer membrane receptor protein involved in Fe transport
MRTSRFARLANEQQATQAFKQKIITAAISFVIGASLASVSAFAAEPTDQDKEKAKNKAVKLETVVVTSRNRAEAAQDVPLPVRVIGGERLDRDDIKSVW